jgi:hypothetical protein
MENLVVFIKGLDAIAIIKLIDRLNKKHQASLLSKLELLIDDKEVFKDVRKLLLDSTNDFCREVIKTLVGDVEY